MTTATQQTLLTPDLVARTVPVVKRFERDFNEWYKDKEDIEFVAPLGSAAYYKEDMLDNKDTVYGDIDFLMKFPLIGGDFPNEHDRANKSILSYRKAMNAFMEQEKPEYLHQDSSGDGLVLFVEGDVVQVDLLTTPSRFVEWNKWRYTPQRGIKGFAMGNLYSSLNRLYNINVGHRGLLIRLKDGKVVSHRLRKDVAYATVSNDYSNFWDHLLSWLGGFMDKDDPVRTVTSKIYPGMNVEEILISDLVWGMVGFFSTLEDNGMLGNEVFPEKTAQMCLDRIKKEYNSMMDNRMNSPQYDKATGGKTSQILLNAVKRDVKRGKEIVNSLI